MQEILFELSWTVSAKTCNEAAVLILQGCSVEFGDVVMLKGSKLYNLEQRNKEKLKINFVSMYFSLPHPFPGFAINLSVHDYIHVQRHELETERSIRWAQQIAEGVVVMSL